MIGRVGPVGAGFVVLLLQLLLEPLTLFQLPVLELVLMARPVGLELLQLVLNVLVGEPLAVKLPPGPGHIRVTPVGLLLVKLSTLCRGQCPTKLLLKLIHLAVEVLADGRFCLGVLLHHDPEGGGKVAAKLDQAHRRHTLVNRRRRG
jgi:hypothetical protein